MHNENKLNFNKSTSIQVTVIETEEENHRTLQISTSTVQMKKSSGSGDRPRLISLLPPANDPATPSPRFSARSRWCAGRAPAHPKYAEGSLGLSHHTVTQNLIPQDSVPGTADGWRRQESDGSRMGTSMAARRA